MNTRRKRAIAIRSSLIGLLVMGIVATVSASDGLRFKIELLSTNELPPTDSDGHGDAIVWVDVEAGMVCFDLSFADSGTPNRAHIHEGTAATASGPIRVPFFDMQATPNDQRHDELEAKRRTEGCRAVTDAALLADIAANPQNYYVNLHNARYPGGSMRGQLDD